MQTPETITRRTANIKMCKKETVNDYFDFFIATGEVAIIWVYDFATICRFIGHEMNN